MPEITSEVTVERLVVPAAEARPHAHGIHHINVLLSSPGRCEWRDGDLVHRPTVGDAMLWPAGCVLGFRRARTFDCVSVRLAPAFLDRVAAASGFNGAFGPLVVCGDDFLARAALTLVEEQDGAAAGRDGLIKAIATTLVIRMLRGSEGRPPISHTRQLGPADLEAVSRYVHAHLEGDLTVARLAALVELSPWHFSRLFKAATGSAPHQFVIEKRLEQARVLLDSTGRKLAAVAAEVGFASQGHLAAHFRKRFGVSPAEYTGRRPTRRLP